MSNIIKIKSEKEFEDYCKNEFQGVSAKDMMFALGAGFDKAIYRNSPNWTELNSSILESLGSSFSELLREPRIKSLGPLMISSYIDKKIPKENLLSNGKGKIEHILAPLAKVKLRNEVVGKLKIIGNSYANIITTNFRMPDEFTKTRNVIDLTRKGQKSLVSKLIFAHGNKDSKYLVYSNEQFAKHYNKTHMASMVTTLRRQEVKFIFLFGFSGQDTKFLNLIKKAFTENNSAKVYFFTSDFQLNPLEEEFFGDIMKTNFKMPVISYSYKQINVTRMLEIILYASKGNKRRIVSSKEWKSAIANALKEKSNVIDALYDSVISPSSSFDVSTFANNVSLMNININTIKESKVDSFIKKSVLEKIIVKGGKIEPFIREYLSIENKTNVGKEIFDSLMVFAKSIDDDFLKGNIYFELLIKNNNLNNIISSDQYFLAKKYLKYIKSENIDSSIYEWPSIEIHSIEDMLKVIKAFLSISISPLIDVLNMSNDTELFEIVNSISSYMHLHSEQLEEFEELLRKYSNIYNDKSIPITWLIMSISLIKAFDFIESKDIWVNNDIEKFSKLLYYLKIGKHPFKVTHSEIFDNLYSKPQENLLYGILTKDKKWQLLMEDYIKTGKSWISKYPTRIKDYKEAIETFDTEKILIIQEEIMDNWDSLDKEDILVSFSDNSFNALKRRDSLDIEYVYDLWLKDNSLAIDEKTHSLFGKIKEMSYSEIILFANIEYKNLENIFEFLLNKGREVFERECKNQNMGKSDFKIYIENNIKKSFFDKPLKESIENNDYQLIDNPLSDFFVLLGENFFKIMALKNGKYSPNWLDNFNNFNDICKMLPVDEDTKDIYKLKFSSLLFDGIDVSIKVLNNMKKNQMFGWNVLTSNTTYNEKKENELLVDLFWKFGGELSRAEMRVLRYNQILNVVRAHYFAEKLDLIIDNPSYVDLILEFVYKNKIDNKNSEINKLLYKANFKKTKLTRWSDKDILKIPFNIFKKIAGHSNHISLEKLIMYSDKNCALQKYETAKRKVSSGIIKYDDPLGHKYKNSKNVFAKIARTVSFDNY